MVHGNNGESTAGIRASEAQAVRMSTGVRMSDTIIRVSDTKKLCDIIGRCLTLYVEVSIRGGV